MRPTAVTLRPVIEREIGQYKWLREYGLKAGTRLTQAGGGSARCRGKRQSYQLCFCPPRRADPGRRPGGAPVATSPFDYYVMTLSWAPGFCDIGGQDTSSTECAAGSGAGFVVHGLWPDNEYRPNPEVLPGPGRLPCRYG